MLANESPSVWKVSEAKARLSEIMRLAENGEAQIIGARKPCVLVSLDMWERTQEKADKSKVHLGRWLLEEAPRVDWEPPPRETLEAPLLFSDEEDA